MTERCKPIMTLLMIVIASLTICKTEGTRTSKQLYLSPYHRLENSPIVVPHVPYWTQYYYPMPAEYPPMYEQPTLENLQLVENLTSDDYLNYLIDHHPEAFTRQGPIISFFQNLFSGGRPFLSFWQNLLGNNKKCPTCPSCPPTQSCSTCVTTAAALASATFKTCETNGFSPASTGTITLSLLTDTGAVCKYFIAVQDPNAIARVQCSATNLGAGSTVAVNPANTLSGTANLVTVTALAGGNRISGLQISTSNFFGIAIANKNNAGGSATCNWDVQTLTPTTAFTTCVPDGLSHANTGTITLAGLTSSTAICQYVIATSIPGAQFSVKCTSANLGVGGTAVGYTLAQLNDGTGGVALTAAAAKVASNIIGITIINKNTAGGAATCSWDFGPTTPPDALTVCNAGTVSFSATSTGTINLNAAALPDARVCTFNVASTNPAATIKVICTTKDLTNGANIGDVTATSENKSPVVDATGVTSTSNYVSIKVDNKKTGGAVACSWTITP